jgi:uncharacterized membrane protein YeaQ/YmgE (transglycosylase-associated protein family)
MIDVILFLIIGLVAGWLASNFVEGRGFGGVGDILIGAVGAFIGGALFDLVGLVFHGFWGNVFVSVVGAVIFLYVVNLFAGKPVSS